MAGAHNLAPHADTAVKCPVGDCDNCPLNTRKVGGWGHVDSDFVIVGEAPGEQELGTGVPFTGPSGKLLWNTIKGAGFDRPVFVTNALQCRPPVGQAPGRAFIEACKPRLYQLLKQHPRKVIIAFGATALKSLTGDYSLKITDCRGQIFTNPEFPGAIIVPSLHPAAILRQHNDFPKMHKDVTYAVGLYLGAQKKDPGITKVLLATEQNLPTIVAGLMRQPLIAADIETSGFSRRHDKVLCIGFCYKKNNVIVIPEELVAHPLLKELFATESVKWLWHNGKFDCEFLHNMGYSARTDEDSMLLHYCLDETRGGHGLKQLASDLLGAPDYESEMKAKYITGRKGASYADIPRPVLYRYLGYDADFTWQVYHELLPKLNKAPDLVSLYRKLLIPASNFLQEVERTGIYVDMEILEKVKDKLEFERNQSMEQIQQLAAPYWNSNNYAVDTGAKTIPEYFNPASPKQLGWLLYDSMGLWPSKVKFKKGGMSTDEATLKLLPEHPIVKALLTMREVNKALSTYVYAIRDLRDDDGRVHTTYLIHGTATGRLSSVEPNVQNVTRPQKGEQYPIRAIYGAPPGRLLCEVDYRSHELRVLAHLSGDPFLTQVFVDKRDLHDEVSIKMYGPNFTNEQRIRAKALNFGIPYGRTAFSIAQEFGIPVFEAQKMIDDWFSVAPKAQKYINECRQRPLIGKSVRNPFGRRRRFSLITEDNIEAVQNEASNAPIQSTASDLTLLSAMEINPLIKPLGAFVVTLVHDSILLELVDDDTVPEVLGIVGKVMREVPARELNSSVPFDVEAKIGRNWGLMKGTEI
jgi:DNA polymerase-1